MVGYCSVLSPRICKRSLRPEFVYLVLLLFLSLVVLPHFYRNLGFSFFYRASPDAVAQVTADNEKRVNAANNYIMEQHHNFSSELFDRLNASRTEFCVLVISVRRPGNPGYLEQVVARLVPQLLQLKNFSFSIYSPEGTQHQEARRLAPYVPVAYGRAIRKHNQLTKYDDEKQDYVAGLQWCLAKGADYHVILEDDALPDLLFAEKLKFIIAHHLPVNDHSWVMLKLFYPEKYQGWGDSISVILELCFVTVFGGLLLTILSILVIPAPVLASFRPPTIEIKWTLVAVRYLLSMLFVLYAMLSLGRPHWEELKKVSPTLAHVVEAKGCCTPAILYPEEHLSQLVNYLSSVHCSNAFPLDIAIDKFAEENHLHKFLTIPNLVRHIGMVSSLPKGYKHVREFQLLLDP